MTPKPRTLSLALPNVALGTPAALTLLVLTSMALYAVTVDSNGFNIVVTTITEQLTNLNTWWLVLVSIGLSTTVGLYCAWVVHTRSFWFRPLLVALLILPATLPYDSVAWALRNLTEAPAAQTILTLTARYIPVAFIFSYLTLSQWSARIVRELGNVGLSEGSILKNVVLPHLPLPILSQSGFLLVLMMLDATGLAYPSGGRFSSLGNSIDDWSRTIQNQNLAHALTLVSVVVSATALASINLIGWWRQSVSRHPSALDRASLTDLHIWLFGGLSLLAAAILALPPIFLRANPIDGFAALWGGMSDYALPTLQYLVTGATLTAVTALAVYSLMQARVSKGSTRATLIFLGVTFAALIVPPVMRGDAFLRPTLWLSAAGGSAILAAMWSWLTTLPITAIIASLHPISHANRVQDVLGNLRVNLLDRLILAIRHSTPVMLVAVGTWAFLTLFDTSIAREVAGFDKPIALWLSDRIITTSDRSVLSATIAAWIALTVGSVAIAVGLTHLRGRRSR